MAWTYGSTYTPVNDYSVKDGLASGTAAKIILGSDIDDELSGIQTALNVKLDASSVSSSGEAAAGIDTESVMTPAGVTLWADSEDSGGGHVGELWGLADPAADRILFYDFSAGAGSMLSQLTVENGVEISGTSLQIAAAAGGAGLTYSTGVLAVGAGSGITVNADDVALTNVSAGAAQPVVITAGTFTFDLSSITEIDIATLDQTADGVVMSDAGVIKVLPLDKIGSKIVAASTLTIDADSEVNVIHVNTGASNFTATIEAEATKNFPIGTEIGFICMSTGTITLAITSDSLVSLDSNLTVKASGGGAYAVKTASATWALIGDLE